MRCMGYLERVERMWVMKVAIMSVRGCKAVNPSRLALGKPDWRVRIT